MKPAPLPSNEAERLRALSEYKILDTLPEDTYDDITKIATEIWGTPIALITLVDKNRQWFKSKQGISIAETSREYSFCAHAIVNPDEAMVVPDARYDERFLDNPLTTGEPHVIFYAGVPLKDVSGNALGALCVIDNRPREFPEYKLDALKALAKLASTHFSLRKANIELSRNEERNKQMQKLVNAMFTPVQALSDSNLNTTQAEQVQSLQNMLQLLGSIPTVE